jgi:sterol desaturase/sphingolipid hydroxylase (fatty acid hydroxylase superfamily)
MSASTMLADFVASAPFQQGYGTIPYILIAMIVVAVVEALIPLHARDRRSAQHLLPNLALTFLTFATNLFFNTALVLTLVWLQTFSFGALHALTLAPWQTVAIAVLALDLSFYLLHVAMHKFPGLWRYHQIHHSDPMLDVTTTIRQHPGESVIRYVGLSVTAITLGVSPAAFMVYRVWSTFQGLLEHANLKLPLAFDSALALVISSPNMHKVHHSRNPRLTDTNYGNITSLWDRLFFTFTSARIGAEVDCGLDGLDERRDQGLFGLLSMPWRHYRRPAGSRTAEV